MKISSFYKITLTINLALALGLLLPATAGAEDEGSGSKHQHEGSSATHDEGSGSKHHHDHEGSSASHDEGSASKHHHEGSGTHEGQEAMMAKWKEFATPGDNHKVLDALVGNWNHIVKWWMSADGEPEESTGNSKLRWIMGGRFLQQTAEGTSKGQPFEGMGIFGYDNGKKEYNSIWFDNMGTGFMNSTGQYDANSKTLTEEGHFTCPFRGQTPFRGVVTIKGNNLYTYEMYAPDMNGKEYRAMEITYTRQ